MDISSEVVSVLDEVLSLKGRASRFALDTPLLGAIPELDSMAVVALITAIEERFGFTVDDDEIEELRHSRKKRQMTIERRFKRDQHIKAKKFAARREFDDD